MLDLNQRPPPCKLGQSFPDRYCPVRKSRLLKRFLAFLTTLCSCSVRVCPAPVAARLQHALQRVALLLTHPHWRCIPRTSLLGSSVNKAASVPAYPSGVSRGATTARHAPVASAPNHPVRK